MSPNCDPRLVSFGKGGFTVHYADGSLMRGYDGPESCQEVARCKDGTVVIDKRPAVRTMAGVRWALAGPLVDVTLRPGQIDPCPNPRRTTIGTAMEADPENPYGPLLSLQAESRDAGLIPGPLDRVDIEEYVRGWRQHGARIGQVIGGEIRWEDEAAR